MLQIKAQIEQLRVERAMRGEGGQEGDSDDPEEVIYHTHTLSLPVYI
jgi:hypothetical protein